MRKRLMALLALPALLTMPLLLALGTSAPAAHATTPASAVHAGPPPPDYYESWADLTATDNGVCPHNTNGQCYVAQGNASVMIGTGNLDNASTLDVAYQGNGYFCIQTGGHYWAAYLSPNPDVIKDDHLSCGTNEQFSIICVSGDPYWLYVEPRDNPGGYVGITSSTDGDLSDNVAGDVFFDTSHLECAGG